MRTLTLYGKSQVIRSLAMSQLLYVVSKLNIPQSFIKRVENEIVGFLWGNKKTKIKYLTLIGKYHEGGIKLPDLESMIHANRVQWAMKIIKNVMTNCYWFSFLRISLRPFGGANILGENFDLSSLTKSKKIKLSEFYKEVFYAWRVVSKTNVVNFEDILRQPIWFNRFIHLKVDNINIRYFVEKGILTVKDVWDRNNGLDWNRMKDKGLSDKDYLAWRCIVGTLPVEWRGILRDNLHVTTEIQIQDKRINVLGKFIPVSKIKTNMIYWNAVGNKFKHPTAQTNISQKLKTSNIDWSAVYSRLYETSIDT